MVNEIPDPVQSWWQKIPLAERKFIGGALLAIIVSGGLMITGQGKLGVSIDTGLIGAALVRYFTDNIERWFGE